MMLQLFIIKLVKGRLLSLAHCTLSSLHIPGGDSLRISSPTSEASDATEASDASHVSKVTNGVELRRKAASRHFMIGADRSLTTVAFRNRTLANGFLKRLKTRPDTRLPQSRAGGQGQKLRSPDHLGRSSKAENRKNLEKVKCEGRTD